MAWRVRKLSDNGDSGSGSETVETLTASDINSMDVSTFENKLISEVEA